MRDFSECSRVVIKVGTNVLTTNGVIDYDYIENLAGQIAALRSRGYKPLVITSGAIGAGARELGLVKRVQKIELRQACAAIGQPILLHRYKLAFQQYQIPIGQVLLTREIFNNRDSYLNLRNAVEKMLDLNVVPIFNENDCISTSEIGPVFGDNDQLSAHVASKLDADLLILLTDIDGLYTDNPRTNAEAEKIALVEEITPEIHALAGDAGTTFSTGGMKTKILAVEVAGKAGCRVVLAHGRESRVLPRILDGEDLGTLFLAGPRLSNRTRWILNSTHKGTLKIDAGAEKALRDHKSLLPSGVLEVEGRFESGDVVKINAAFKAVVNMNSSDLDKIKGLHTSEIAGVLKRDVRMEIARPEDIVAL